VPWFAALVVAALIALVRANVRGPSTAEPALAE
jgi:hypothetical protein